MMEFAQSDEILDSLKNIIHAETQRHKNRFDLTVSKIDKFCEGGSLDFGGDEFEPAETQTLRPKKQNSGDDYGWWKLEAGTYRVEFNENIQIPDQSYALLFPHEHTLKAGLNLNNKIIGDAESETFATNIHVPGVGCNIKENARIAALYIVKTQF